MSYTFVDASQKIKLSEWLKANSVNLTLIKNSNEQFVAKLTPEGGAYFKYSIRSFSPTQIVASSNSAVGAVRGVFYNAEHHKTLVIVPVPMLGKGSPWVEDDEGDPSLDYKRVEVPSANNLLIDFDLY